jgi:hypothetical protein
MDLVHGRMTVPRGQDAEHFQTLGRDPQATLLEPVEHALKSSGGSVCFVCHGELNGLYQD